MASTLPFVVAAPEEPDAPTFEAPRHLVARYLELSAQRKALEDQLAYLRGELEMVAASLLSESAPKGRFLGPGGHVTARLQPTCSFDRQAVARELQRMGRLAEVAQISGPSLARYLAKEPLVAARLAELVRPRRSVALYPVHG